MPTISVAEEKKLAIVSMRKEARCCICDVMEAAQSFPYRRIV
jgi:hypothetical protein